MVDAALVEYLQRANTVEMRPAPAAVTKSPGWWRPVTPACFREAADRQQLEPWRVLAVMQSEGGRVGQFRANTNGSYDLGPMQVNTVHLPELSRLYQVPAATIAQLLAYDGCFNVSVGAYLLRKRTNEAAGDFWYGIGGYHSKTPSKSKQYILRVHDHMQRIVASSGQGAQQR